MKFNCIIKKLTIFTAILFIFVTFSFSQTPKLPAPRQEKLLNNLKLLIWTQPAADKVSVKLRIHSGAAFDQKDKEGTMALLANALFPNETVRDFFQDELGGTLDVETNYDYLQINATANSDKVLDLLETLANAVTNLQINQELTAKLRASQSAKVQELEKIPSYAADRAAARQLYGDFPYGRAISGTSKSLPKIDYADLIFAQQRFLNADNATLAVVGNVQPDLIYRAVRRYFGAWEKSDKKIPATFAQPENPDSKEFSIEMMNVENDLRRYAIMTVARNDKDFYATKILTEIWRNQFCYNDESKLGKSLFEPHLLRGTYMISSVLSSKELPVTARNPCALLLQKDGKTVYPLISQNDFDSAKSKVVADLNQKALSVNDLADLWLDVDTYKLGSVKDEIKKASNVTLEDVQRVSENLQKQPFVSVIVKKSGELKQ